MDKFLEKYNLPNLNEKEAESLVTADEIKAVIKKLLAHKSLGLYSFTGEFYKTFKEELTPTLHKLFQKTQERQIPNSLYEASIILIPKRDKDTT